MVIKVGGNDTITHYFPVGELVVCIYNTPHWEVVEGAALWNGLCQVKMMFVDPSCVVEIGKL